jgi:hypothetical protein
VTEDWLTLPIDCALGECPASGEQVVCTAGRQTDVWIIDDFDRLLR